MHTKQISSLSVSLNTSIEKSNSKIDLFHI
jgi:hypothetical protein